MRNSMVRSTTNRLTLLRTKNIPVIAVAGMFFFCALSSADSLQLATDLFAKNEWDLCRRECQRALLAQTEPVERFQLLEALCANRNGTDPLMVIAKLRPFAETNTDMQVGAIATYEAGRLYWQLDQPKAALDSFALSFQTTTNKALFLRSACSLFLLFDEHPELKPGKEDLISQISTSRDQWYGALFAECAKPDPQKDQPQSPSWIIRFYRDQISPAIGNRCVLDPSCSEYFNQAQHKHGLKAIPMIADRFCREPDVSNKKESPVIMPDGQIRYRDPIENHDFWMKK